ncbi:MAG: STAS/SEC14 domain-containing protein [Rhodospirillales bacterium]|nr:MAG: STAS/SEC14 domain-containing protein [Rhodospirillales bacterium]
MLQVMPESEGIIVEIKASGTITEDDKAALIERLSEVMDTRERYRLLYDWEALDGWDKGARSANVSFLMSHRGLVDRVAVVCADRLVDDVERLRDLYKYSEVRHFTPDQREAAWVWLREA